MSATCTLDPAILKLLREDRRYPLAAYIFIFEALNYGHEVLGLGCESPSEPCGPRELSGAGEPGAEAEEEESGPQRHVTGQELCEAIRQFALEQYGYMAKLVLSNWGMHSTGDFGEIVFNLIRIGRMRKTPHDRREDFEHVYDFDQAFCRQFRIVVPERE